ncbi:putative reverse transcriptase zinc-binding domain-containing protein [Helianthus annuus]|nr:putative reverse transcriptase zinc-binding domain-containing protein [Helianthus annuus]
MVADRIKMLGSVRVFEWSWKVQLIDSRLLASFESMCSSLDQVQISGSSDRWKWMSETSGVFSVKRSLYSNSAGFNGYVMEWSKSIPAKCNIHSWRMELNRIPTREVLKKRNIQVGDSLCPFCGSDEESTDHLFIACYVASNVWNGISGWCRIPNIFAFSIKDLLDLHKTLGASEKKKEAVQGRVRIAC